MTKCKSVDETLFYINKTIENGWSRRTDEFPRCAIIQYTGKGYNESQQISARTDERSCTANIERSV